MFIAPFTDCFHVYLLLVCIEYRLADRTGLKECKAQNDRICGYREQSAVNIVRDCHGINEDTVDAHDNHDEEALETKCKKSSCIVVSDLSPLSVRESSEGDRSDRCIKIDLDHTTVHDDRDENGDDLHTHRYDHGLKRKLKKLADIHGQHLRLHLLNDLIRIDRRASAYHSCRSVYYILPDIEYRHDYVERIRYKPDGDKGLEYPLKEHPGIYIVQIVFLRDHAYKFIGQNKCDDHACDRDDDVVGKASHHIEDA